MKQLRAQDAQFLYMETENNLSNVTMICLYEKPSGTARQSPYELVRSAVGERLHTNAIFTRKLVRVPLDLDYPYWVDDPYFNLDSHLHCHQLAKPGDWGELRGLVGRIHSRSMDMGRPLWEIHVVQGVEQVDGLTKGAFAVVTKVHHSAVDGAATMRFFAGLSDLDPEGTPILDLSVESEPSGDPPSGTRMLQNCLENHIRSPLKMAETLWRATPTVLPAVKNALLSPDEKSASAPGTPLNKPVSPHKCFHGVEFDFADMKLIASAVPETKINDVVIAICSGALRNYLTHHKALPEDPLIAWVPINARPLKGVEGGEDGNQITAMTVDLHTDLGSPLERLKEITHHTQLTKAAKIGVSARVMTDVSQHMPGATMALASRLILSSGVTEKLCNLAISNVPGPQSPIYMRGAKCVRQFGMVPLGAGMGLFIVAISYNGRMTLSITSTEEIMPDIDYFGDCLTSAMEDLKSVVTKVKGKSGSKRRRSGVSKQ